MSYILDALRKADAERARGAVPGLHAAQGPDIDSPSDKTRMRLLAGAVGVLALALLGSLAWQMSARNDGEAVALADPSTPTSTSTPLHAQAQAPAPTQPQPLPDSMQARQPSSSVTSAPDATTPQAANPAPPTNQSGIAPTPSTTLAAASPAQAQPPAIAANTGMREPPPLLDQPREIRPPAREPRHEAAAAGGHAARHQAPPPARTAEPAPPRSNGAAPSTGIAGTKAGTSVAAAGMAAPQTPPANATEPASRRTTAANTAPGARATDSHSSGSPPANASNSRENRPALPTPSTPAPATAPAAANASHVYAVNELPDGVRATLPKYAVSGSSYSENPAARLLIVNGQVAREGDMLPGGAAVEQIKLRGAVLKYKGYRYELSY